MDEIRYYMEENLLSVGPDDTAAKAARSMLGHKVGSLLVKSRENEYIGIVTEGDLSRKIIAQSRDPEKTRVREVMSQPIHSIESSRLMPTALIQMNKNHIRHLAVTDGGKIVGLLSINDFIAYYANLYSRNKPAAESSGPVA
ncbi:MAG: CBS domain-containing protein [Nitrospinae bacterium]|nr:CBS domain-containing protein [Nitrospinota bacterium]